MLPDSLPFGIPWRPFLYAWLVLRAIPCSAGDRTCLFFTVFFSGLFSAAATVRTCVRASPEGVVSFLLPFFFPVAVTSSDEAVNYDIRRSWTQ